MEMKPFLAKSLVFDTTTRKGVPAPNDPRLLGAKGREDCVAKAVLPSRAIGGSAGFHRGAFISGYHSY